MVGKETGTQSIHQTPGYSVTSRDGRPVILALFYTVRDIFKI